MTSETDATIARIARHTRVAAIVGLSPNPTRPSHGVARYLQSRGIRIVPVNPGHGGQTILGETVYASLSDIPPALNVDMVDIFRRPEAAGAVVDAALAALPELRTIWMQLGVTHPEAAARAEAAGVTVIQDRCPHIDFPRLGV